LSNWLARSTIVRRALFVQRLGDLVGMKEADVESVLRRLSAKARSTRGPSGSQESGSHPTGALRSGEPATSDPGPDNFPADLAWADRASTIRSVQLAELQVIGCLLHQPELFHCTLSDGMHLDEAVMPAEMLTRDTQRLYQRIYDRLGDQKSLTVNGLLADLASEGEDDLADLGKLVTQADTEVAQSTGEKPHLIEEMLVAAVDCILAYRRDLAYRQTRDTMVSGWSEDNREPSDEEQTRLLRQVVEHHRGNPSPSRIARIGR
ncbi:MAG TPA: hypothetical protein VGC81_07080, partial [Candidatus Methylomirabilis sp.]